MEKIIIKNFLIFDELEMPIKKFNILIGEQASGKSLLARLVYFFNEIPFTLSRLLSQRRDINSFEDTIIDDFIHTFRLDKHEGSSSKYCITYYYSQQVSISIEYKDKLYFEFSEEFKKIFKETIETYETKKNNSPSSSGTYSVIGAMILGDIFFKKLDQALPSTSQNYIFIPANRSFFSILEDNSFALLTNDKVTIDKFIKDFGVQLQYLKNNHVKNNDSIHSYFDKVIKGKYEKIDGKDYLIGDNYKVPLSKASSGQQEVFPMMLMLCSLFNEEMRDYSNFVFIEEPEAHLFPKAQNQVISAILYAMFKTHSKFFITTHSPYILSALNNSIYANELIKKEKLTVDDYIEMSDGAYPLDFEDISAYSLKEGKLIDIKDSEFKMIGGDILDSVSNEFGEVMDKLMELDD